MGLGSFLKSKQFIFSLIGAFVIVAILIFGSLQFLSIYTRHGDEIPVPDLKKMKAEKAMDLVAENGFEIVIIDTVDFDPKFPPLTISSQDPKANDAVKQGRTIYVKINAKGYSSVRLPNLDGRTLRHSVAILESLGLVKGQTKYEPDFAKDVVLRIEQDGRILRAGDKVLKNSKIDFILGDGMLGYKPEPDSLGEMYEDTAPAIDSIF
ncbi:PASTA domain-containing protein [Flavobacterium sp. xlx-214]|uniref:PASTA domain-containing protein n=1 Tax=unclassified Flavobacterium TaxID=196869 RepID=UPI0013D09A0A|nr:MULTISPECIES: PASTA domain-containing protein [unclassified Flavobacterium]MBA5791616.1 PASTA domain-containing protein [Flavobacterium sp. xlx-221]QMI82862.1 PASTA domain-containing protein [Flavobacterium sp. xlx-214]